MYTLMLTREERKAINWVGYRYWHGDDFESHLFHCFAWQCQRHDRQEAWDSNEDIVFEFKEHEAWNIADNIMKDGLACFGSELVNKITDFLDSIV